MSHVVVSPTPDEFEVAWRNVVTLDHTRWDNNYLRHISIPVPSGIRLLAELVDAPEAVSGWRFPPLPNPGGRQIFMSVTTSTLYVDSIGSVTVEGDSFSNIGAGATIINRSTLTNSLNAARAHGGEETANALKSVSEIVEKSGNADAADNLNAFNDELTKPNPKKSLLKSFWNAITDSLGPLTEVASAAEHITKLFS